MTLDELEAQARRDCPHCAAGNVVKLRAATGEWTHDFYSTGGFAHTICGADALRREVVGAS